MNFWGKIIGFILGLKVGGFFGAMLGLWLGHYFDKALAEHLTPKKREELQKIQAVFFQITFQVMGHIAKADGQVSERSIQAARAIMQKYAPSDAQQKIAIQYFNEGKQPDFDFESALVRLRMTCHREPRMLRMFLEIQLQSAYAEGFLSPAKKQKIQELCQTLQFGIPNFLMWDFLYGQMYGGGFGQQSGGYKQHFRQDPQSSLKQAYAILEVDSSASDVDIKKSYRRLMSQHHPDKLAANGLPPEMVKEATEKTQQIQKAYDDVKRSRGIS